MTAARMVRAALVAAVLLLLAVAPVSAHNTIYTTDKKLRFVYGHLDEPIYTFQKTGLDLAIVDNATNNAISGYQMPSGSNAQPRLYVSYRYGEAGGPELNITTKFAAQHGREGRYTYPIVFTQPGLYYLLIKGTIEGTYYELALPPAHEVPSSEEIMWPQQVPNSADQASRIEALERQVEELKRDGGDAPAPGLAMVLLLAIIATLVVRRR